MKKPHILCCTLAVIIGIAFMPMATFAAQQFSSITKPAKTNSHTTKSMQVNLTKIKKTVTKDDSTVLIIEDNKKAKKDVVIKKMPVYSHSSIKRYEDHSAITAKGTPNYRISNILAKARPDGTLEVDGRKVVAMGQSYGQVGDKFNITLETNGKKHVLRVILGDTKKNCDTAKGAGYHCADGHIVEGIVNAKMLPPSARLHGDLNSVPGWEGNVIKIEKIK